MTEDNIPKAKSEFNSLQKHLGLLNDVKLGEASQNGKSFCTASSTELRSSASVQGDLDDVTTCCICDETYRDPVILPCIHTFCLTCLQHIGKHTGKNAGDPVPCPICRQEFTIPEDGLAALKKNFFMVRLIEIAGSTRQGASSVCDMHKHENLCLYCTDCNEILCLVCVHEWHTNHRMLDLRTAVDILCSQLESDINTAKDFRSVASKKKQILLDKRFALCKKVQGFKTEVDQVRCDLKMLIDQQADSLLQNLESLKKEQLSDIEVEEKKLCEHLDCLNGFEICSAELASHDQHDIIFCKNASKLTERMVELKRLNEYIVEHQLHSFDIDFTRTIPSSLEIFKTKNIIGVIKANTNYNGSPELVKTILAIDTAVDEGAFISGMAVSDNDVILVYDESPIVSIYDSHIDKCRTQMNLKGFVDKVDLGDCVSVVGNVYVVNRITREIIRIDENQDITKWSTENNAGRLSVSAELTIVVAGYETSAIREYSLQGTLIQEIKLCSSIIHPQHAVKLRNGNFVVSHGSYDDNVNRVCMVNNVGGIIKSIGGCNDDIVDSLLGVPTCLVVDKAENVLVLDSYNQCVLLLDPDLEFRRKLLTDMDGLRRPVAMHLDEKTSQLYIADCDWEYQHYDRVLVFNLT